MLIESGLVGEVMAALATPQGQADPYPHYARLHAAGTLGQAPDGALVIVGHTACADVLKDHRLAKNPGRALTAAGLPDWQARPSLRMLYGSLLMLNPPDHTRLRRAVSATFTPRRVEALRSAVESIADGLVEACAGRTDFVDTVAFPLPVTVIGELIGIPPADRARFQDLVHDWTMVLEVLNPLAVDRADAAAAEIADYLAALAAERRARPRDDLASALAAVSDDDGRDEQMTAEELVSLLALLLGAGFETTTGLLANGLLALLAHPDQADRLRADDTLAPSATEELLRYDSPVQMIFGRATTEPMEIAGVDVAAGTRLITLLGAANRDPAVYADPDVLLLDRRGPAPLSFGGGIHYCLGAPLARLEATVLLPRLLRAYPDLALAGHPVHRDGLALHGYVALPIDAR